MAQQTINIGATGGDGTGDTARAGGTKINANFGELYAREEMASGDAAKLAGIEDGATADQTGAEIKVAYEGEANTNAFTDAEKSKLAGLDAALFVGTYANLAALQSAHPSAGAGSYAYVDAGASSDVQQYIWDESDADWVLVQGAGTSETPASVKAKYESNPDTNALTDALLSKLNGIAAGAEVNLNAAETRALIAGLVNGLQLARIELGHASDTTLERIAAGRIAVEGNEVLTDASGDVLAAAALAAGDTFPFFDASDSDNPKLGDPGDLVALLSLATTGGAQTLTGKTLVYTINEQTGTAYTLALGDSKVTMDNAGANALTIPDNATEAFPVGTIIGVSMVGAGTTTVQGATGVTVNGVSGGGAEILAQYTGVTLTKLAADVWLMEGNHGAVA